MPPTRRPRAHHRVNLYPGARRYNETKMFSDHDETSPSITAVSALLLRGWDDTVLPWYGDGCLQ